MANLIHREVEAPFVSYIGGGQEGFIDAYDQIVRTGQEALKIPKEDQIKDPKTLIWQKVNEFIWQCIQPETSVGVVTPISQLSARDAIRVINALDGQARTQVLPPLVADDGEILPGVDGLHAANARSMGQFSFGLLVPQIFSPETNEQFGIGARNLIHGILKPWDGMVHSEPIPSLYTPSGKLLDRLDLVPLKEGFREGDPTQLAEIRNLPENENAGTVSQALLEAALYGLLCENPSEDPYREYVIRVPANTANGRALSNRMQQGYAEWVPDVAASRKRNRTIIAAGSAGCKQTMFGWLRHWQPNEKGNPALPWTWIMPGRSHAGSDEYML